jgi:hypothetical protein
MGTKQEKDHSIGGALREFISANKLQPGIDRLNAKDAWKKHMGKGVNNYTTSVDLRNGTLFVSLSSSVLREELSLGKSKIIALLNEELGRELIKKLVLR